MMLAVDISMVLIMMVTAQSIKVLIKGSMNLGKYGLMALIMMVMEKLTNMMSLAPFGLIALEITMGTGA